ncbi:MAG: chemotaxis protein CheA [Pirellulaceae bacterium]
MNAVEMNDELLAGFIDESIDSLQDLPVLLEDHRLDPDSGAINPVFRAVHSIKGNAGFFGLLGVKGFSHALENTLDEVRNGQVELTQDLQRAFVDGFDLLNDMLHHVMEGEAFEEIRPQDAELLERVLRLADEARCQLTPEQRLLAEAVALAEEIAASDIEQARDWARRVRALVMGEDDGEKREEQAGEESAQAALRPTDFQGVACQLGGEDVTNRVAPLLDLFLAFDRGGYTEDVGRSFLQAAAEFTSWADDAGYASLASAAASAAEDFQTIFNSPLDVDATLLSLVWDCLVGELSQLVVAAPQAASEPDPTKDAAAREDQASAEETEPAAGRGKEPGKSAGKNRLIRVREERLDEFMDDVSCLFITCERLKDLQRRMVSENKLDELVEELRQINHTLAKQTNDLQGSVVGLRKVPARGLLSKFPRVARSLAGNLGKKLDVHLIGEEIEIDKSLVEELDAPVMHMVRNVCDHAIETPEERLAAGKPEAGALTLKCELTQTHVVVTVEDDGRGLDPAKLIRKALEKGVLSEQQAELISRDEALELIFHPGFSTAEKVSDVSGRGVGMDVVRTKLREHDGDVKVDSHVGVGTTIRLEIPIRQAVLVIDGLLLGSGDDQFVIPFEHIREIVELDGDDLKSVQGEHVATIRGEPFAAVDLTRLLDTKPRRRGEGATIAGVLIGCKLGSACLLVDRVLGQRKVVVNAIGEILPGIDKVAGVAQLGGSRLALVLSAPDLVKAMRELPHTTRADSTVLGA